MNGISPVPPKPAWRDSANFSPEGTLQVVSVAVDNNANFSWLQHFIHHLSPFGIAGFVLANGSMSSNQPGEGDIRRANRPVHFSKN
jgi:type I restriction enzyme M protein